MNKRAALTDRPIGLIVSIFIVAIFFLIVMFSIVSKVREQGSTAVIINKDALYSEGMNAYNDGDCEKATELLEDFVNKYPGDSRVDDANKIINSCKSSRNHHKI